MNVRIAFSISHELESTKQHSRYCNLEKCIISETILAFAIWKDSAFTAKSVPEGMAWVYSVFISVYL